MLKALVEDVSKYARNYNQCQVQIDRKFDENCTALLRSKRIIGCTTTGAAKYRDSVNAASAGV